VRRIFEFVRSLSTETRRIGRFRRSISALEIPVPASAWRQVQRLGRGHPVSIHHVPTISPSERDILPSIQTGRLCRDLRDRFRDFLISACVCCLWWGFGQPCLRIQKSRSWRTKLSREIRLLLAGIRPWQCWLGRRFLGRALLWRVQPKRFELPSPFRRKVAQTRDVDASRETALHCSTH
jgi:hypothetical protein